MWFCSCVVILFYRPSKKNPILSDQISHKVLTAFTWQILSIYKALPYWLDMHFFKMYVFSNIFSLFIWKWKVCLVTKYFFIKILNFSSQIQCKIQPPCTKLSCFDNKDFLLDEKKNKWAILWCSEISWMLGGLDPIIKKRDKPVMKRIGT